MNLKVLLLNCEEIHLQSLVLVQVWNALAAVKVMPDSMALFKKELDVWLKGKNSQGYGE